MQGMVSLFNFTLSWTDSEHPEEKLLPFLKWMDSTFPASDAVSLALNCLIAVPRVCVDAVGSRCFVFRA